MMGKILYGYCTWIKLMNSGLETWIKLMNFDLIASKSNLLIDAAKTGEISQILGKDVLIPLPPFPWGGFSCPVWIIFIFTLSLAGVSMCLPADLFLQAWRPSAYVVSGTVNWLSLFIIGMIFPYVVVSLQLFPFKLAAHTFLYPCILFINTEPGKGHVGSKGHIFESHLQYFCVPLQ